MSQPVAQLGPADLSALTAAQDLSDSAVTRVQQAILDDLTAAKNYRRWLASLAAPYLGDDPLEIGSGLGDYAAEWLTVCGRLTVSDADVGRVDVLDRRFVEHPNVTVRLLAAPVDEDGAHSAVVAYNVVEHIADDLAAVQGLTRLVRPGGAVVLLVPAFPSAMSRFDRAVGHYRRYRRAALGEVLSGAGLSIEQLRYVNAPGLLSWYAVMRICGLMPKAGPLLSCWDRAVVPVARRLERICPPPFGQSLFAVGRKS